MSNGKYNRRGVGFCGMGGGGGVTNNERLNTWRGRKGFQGRGEGEGITHRQQLKTPQSKFS